MPLWKRNLVGCWFGAFMTGAGMSLILPFLPLFIEELGVHQVADIERWSGTAFGATFLLAAVFSPIWGRLADTHGRKLMLLRASLGMAIVTALTGFSQDVIQLVVLRLLMGTVSGYISASITLVATQTPREKVGWALGILSTAGIAGSLLGPLLGGSLAEVLGLRHIFFLTGALLLVAFGITLVVVQERHEVRSEVARSAREVWKAVPQGHLVFALFFTSFLLQAAMLAIEPIVTVYVKQLLADDAHVALYAGAVVAASGLAALVAAPLVGRLSDAWGPRRVLLITLLLGALLFLPQAFVHHPWELMAWRFLAGLATAGMLPTANALLRRLVPEAISGRVYGFNQSAQYLGNISGPVLGGQVAAVWGIPAVFFLSSAMLALNAVVVALAARGASHVGGGVDPGP